MNTDTDTNTRLDQLESRLRRQQVVSLLSLILAALAVAWGWQSRTSVAASRATTVEAERFVLKDAKGKERGVWEVDDKNFAQLRIAEPKAAGIRLGENPTGPGLSLTDSTCTASMRLGGGAAVVSVSGPNNDYCNLSSGGTQFFLQSKEGRLEMDAGHSPGGSKYGPSLVMQQGSKTRVALGKGFSTGQVWRLRFLNPDGTTAFHETPPTAPPN